MFVCDLSLDWRNSLDVLLMMFKQEPKLCSNHDHSRCWGCDFNDGGFETESNQTFLLDLNKNEKCRIDTYPSSFFMQLHPAATPL
jgi:hypothetical protein